MRQEANCSALQSVDVVSDAKTSDRLFMVEGMKMSEKPQSWSPLGDTRNEKLSFGSSREAGYARE